MASPPFLSSSSIVQPYFFYHHVHIYKFPNLHRHKNIRKNFVTTPAHFHLRSLDSKNKTFPCRSRVRCCFWHIFLSNPIRVIRFSLESFFLPFSLHFPVAQGRGKLSKNLKAFLKTKLSVWTIKLNLPSKLEVVNVRMEITSIFLGNNPQHHFCVLKINKFSNFPIFSPH